MEALMQVMVVVLATDRRLTAWLPLFLLIPRTSTLLSLTLLVLGALAAQMEFLEEVLSLPTAPVEARLEVCRTQMTGAKCSPIHTSFPSCRARALTRTD